MTLKTFTIKLISSIQYLIYYELVVLFVWLTGIDTFNSLHIEAWHRPITYLLILIAVIKLVIAFRYIPEPKLYNTFYCELDGNFAHEKCNEQCDRCKAEEKKNLETT